MAPWLELIGRLESVPERTALVTPRVAGQVQQLLVVPGERLRAGQLLGRLAPSLLQAALDRAAAQVQIDEAELARREHGPRPQELEVARQELSGAAAAVTSLSAQVQATRELRAHDEVAAVRLAERESDLAAAEAAREAASARLELLLAGTRAEEIEAARGALAASRAEWEAARQRLSFCTLVSPIEGTLTELSARVGMWVDTSTRLARVEDLSVLFARVRLPRHAAPEVSVGAQAELRLAGADPDLPAVTGSLARLAAQADPGSGERSAWIELANPEGLLLPGMACRVRIRLPVIESALSMPLAAVADRSGTQVVSVVREGRAYEVELTLGVATGDRVQVLSGLAAGDTVLLRGGYGLPDGCPVSVSWAEPAASDGGSDAGR